MKNVDFSDVIDFLEGPGVRNWQFTDNGIKLINIRNLVNDKINLDNTTNHLSKEEVLKKYKHFLLEEGDFVMASSGVTWGKIAEVKKEHLPLCLNTSIIKLKTKSSDVEKKFLWYFIKSQAFISQIDRIITGSAQPNFGPSHLKKIKFPLPTLPQQQKIANILDAADELRQNDKKLIAKYDDLAQALFLDMFGDPVSNPKGWEKAFLKSVTNKITDGTHFSPEPQAEGFPYITAKHVKNHGLDFYSKPTYITEEAHNEIYKRCTPEYGDVLYIKDGATTGIACINTFDEPFSMLSSLALIKPNKKLINSYYLCYWLNNPRIKSKLLTEFMSGAAIQRYTLTKINSFQLIVPPLSLQRQFAERVTLIEEQKSIAQKSLEKSEALFNSLLQKAFNGEL